MLANNVFQQLERVAAYDKDVFCELLDIWLNIRFGEVDAIASAFAPKVKL